MKGYGWKEFTDEVKSKGRQFQQGAEFGMAAEGQPWWAGGSLQATRQLPLIACLLFSSPEMCFVFSNRYKLPDLAAALVVARGPSRHWVHLTQMNKSRR